MTVFYGQTDSSKICLTYPQFKFYAKAYLEREGLKKDTAFLMDQIKIQEDIIEIKDEQLQDSKDIIVNKDLIIDLRTKDYKNLAVKFQSQDKKVKRLRQGLLTTSGIIIVLISLILLK